VEIRAIKGTLYLKMPTNILQHFLRFPWNLVNFGTAGVRKNLLRGCGFREYWHSESRTLHATVSEFLSVISTFFVSAIKGTLYLMMPTNFLQYFLRFP
jgi:hypothetical protein